MDRASVSSTSLGKSFQSRDCRFSDRDAMCQMGLKSWRVVPIRIECFQDNVMGG